MAKAKPDAGAPRATLAFGQSVPEGSKVAWRYVYCAGFDDTCKKCGAVHRTRSPLKALPPPFKCRKCESDEYERQFHHFSNVECNCRPGPQYVACTTEASEIGSAGGRGSGKSESGFPLTIRGNPEKVREAIARGEQPKPVDVSYINFPQYRFLVLRRNAKDLKDCWDRAKSFYSVFGATFNDSDRVVRFPSGAEGIFDHLATDDAWSKYQGINVHLIWLEEATQIPSEELYVRVMMSCRSSFPDIKPKMFATANPGGPGMAWFKARFVDVGPEREIYTDPITKLTRIYIHSTVFDNPYFLRDDSVYIRNLMSIPDEHLRKMWLSGDFDALEGQFFTEFRDKLRPSEKGYPDGCPNALHVIPADSIELLPHWKRWISMDWGFSHDSAVYFHCHSSDQRIHTYREMVESRVGAREWGVRIARQSIADLNGLPNRHMDMYLSPDAFAKRDDENTPAEQIAAGIAEVLGKGSVFIMDLTDDERALPGDQAWESLKARKFQQQHRTSITIHKAATHRVSGWSLMRDMLRWWPTVPVGEREMDPKIAEELLLTRGVLAYAEYKRHIDEMRSEVLPKWRILDSCPRLIKAMAAVQHKEGTEDIEDQFIQANDCVDSARYGIMGFDGAQNAVPQSHYVRERIADLPAGASAHSKAMAANYAASQYNKQNQGMRQFNLPRTGGRFRRSLAHVQ